MMTQTEHQTRLLALTEARLAEKLLGRPAYVLRILYTGRTGDWIVTSEMPFMGEWYTADGSRHG